MRSVDDDIGRDILEASGVIHAHKRMTDLFGLYLEKFAYTVGDFGIVLLVFSDEIGGNRMIV